MNMKNWIVLGLLMVFYNSVFAVQSIIVEAEGYACMGDDKSRKQTEKAAMADAKRNASEYALANIQSGTVIENLELKEDIVSAFSKAKVKMIEKIHQEWYKESGLGDCHKVSIKAEVIPDENVMQKKVAEKTIDDPRAPLNVKLWTDKENYRAGDHIKVYLKGNKPFYARVVYKDQEGNLIQLLPNPYRTDNYFNGGIVYEIPSGNDQFDLEVSPPFGKESITVYGSTSPMGNVNLQTVQGAGVYLVNTTQKELGFRSRGIKIKSSSNQLPMSVKQNNTSAEFVENKAQLKTNR